MKSSSTSAERARQYEAERMDHALGKILTVSKDNVLKQVGKWKGHAEKTG
jgi:hypothetical protein